MLRCRLASASTVAIFLIASLGFARAAPRAVLELFTSQGCSSCPPADKLLGEYAKDPSVVALSLPINIWDYLGWKDTLALPGHTARQRAYAELRGDRQVYTPQIVVNGTMHALGSDRAAIDRAIAETDRNPAIMSVPVLVSTGGNRLTVAVKAGTDGQISGEVWLCPLATAVAVAIGRGENRGRTLTYHNVVRGWRKLGDFTGTDANWSVPLSEIESGNIDAAAVMVQEGTRAKPGLILGAAFTPLGGEPTADRALTTEAR
ncbi:MAG TPA: DUF1223 domain-containing protein [Xanthobacteraceae bacterium]|nr:DUF1223 domain-containing protein [Xanthobacteraceae bacterium]